MRAVLLSLSTFLALSGYTQLVTPNYYDSLLLSLNRMDEIRATHMVKRHYFILGIRRKGVKVVHIAKGNIIEHPVGIWQWYWPNGQLKEHVNFNIQGFPQGISNRYYPDGQLMCRVIYDPPIDETYNNERYSFYWDDYDRYEIWFNTDGSFYYEGKFSGSTKTGMHIEVDNKNKFHRYYYVNDILQASVVVIPGRAFFNVNAHRADFKVRIDSADIFRIPPKDILINPARDYMTHCVHYKQKRKPGLDLSVDSVINHMSFDGMQDAIIREGVLVQRHIYGADSAMKGTWKYDYSPSGDTIQAIWNDAGGQHRTVVFSKDSGKIQKKIFDPESNVLSTDFFWMDAHGQMLAMEHNGYGYRYQYDDNGFLTHTTITKDNGAWQQDVQYQNDHYGMVRYSYTHRNNQVLAHTRYFYDVYGRISKVIDIRGREVHIDLYSYQTLSEERN